MAEETGHGGDRASQQTHAKALPSTSQHLLSWPKVLCDFVLARGFTSRLGTMGVGALLGPANNT